MNKYRLVILWKINKSKQSDTELLLESNSAFGQVCETLWNSLISSAFFVNTPIYFTKIWDNLQ